MSLPIITMVKIKYTMGGKSSRSNKKTPRAGKARAGTAKVSNTYVRDKLDAQANAYMHLLKHPCSGPLTASVDPINGAIISRYASEFSYTAPSGGGDLVICLSPGDINSNSTTGGLYQFAGVAGSTLTAAALLLPGMGALASTASTIKPIAACIDVRWGGTEFNRAGLVGKFISSGKLLEATDTIVANASMAQCFEVVHMPADTTTLKWRPNSSGDLLPVDPGNLLSGSGNASIKSQIGIIIPSLAVGQTIFFRVTTVFEWVPIRIGGQVISPYTPSSTVGHGTVLAAIDKDVGWLTRLEHDAGRALSFAENAISTGGRIYRMAQGAAEMVMPFL